MKWRNTMAAGFVVASLAASQCEKAAAALVTDPNDPRTWLGANVGTFADLYFGSDTLANRQAVVDAQLLDDGIFDPTGYRPGTLLATPWALGIAGGSHLAGDARGYSFDLTGTGGFAYTTDNSIDVFTAANSIDNQWFQSSHVTGETVFDLGGLAANAAVFNTIDHGPIPHEAIESSVYLSNDLVTWELATVKRVWLEGWQSILGIEWDGFVYAVGTDDDDTFRYMSVNWGGPGALISDGDNEINGVMGLDPEFDPIVPEPNSGLLMLASCGLAFAARRRR